MHPTESTEMRCQQVILGLWRDISDNSKCLVSSFFRSEKAKQDAMVPVMLTFRDQLRDCGLSNTILYELSIGYLTRLLQLTQWIKGQRISWLGHLKRMEEDKMPKKIFTQELEGTKRMGKAQERMERRSRKRSSSANSENVERVGDK